MDLFSHLDPTNTIIITPNRRLSPTLLKQYNQFQLAQNHTCWETLIVLPITTWIEQLWQQYCASTLQIPPLILTNQQEHILWEEILQASPTHATLLQLAETADLAKSAWGLLKQWRVDPNQPDFLRNEDSKAFQVWAQLFQKKCQENNWLDTYSLFDLICEQLSQKKLTLPQQLIFTGFTEYTPQQQFLFSICASLNIKITHTSPSIPSEKHLLQRLGLPDEEAEIYSMARWAKSLYQQSNHYRIGCIVPHLEKSRDKILHTFATVFSDEHTLTLDPTTLPFNLSAGKSLTSYSIIHSALLLLNLFTQSFTKEDIQHLLHSPFLGDAENERIKRAHFDNYCRKKNITCDFNHLEKLCPKLAKRIADLRNYQSTLNELYTLSQWTTIFVDQLTILGWPGERSVNSQEYQVIQRWLALLNEYQSCDFLLQRQTYHQALHYLNRVATKTIFQIQSPEAPIQILGLLEAAEIPFDYLWLMGLNDATWPPAAKPNPFIPQRLQKTLNMPHASAERELIYSKQLTQQLKNSSPYCIFSYPLKNADNELRPSALITHIKEISYEELILSSLTLPANILFQSKDLEFLQDEQALPIMQNEKIRGGTTLLKLQAACPFRAFAEMRLHAQPEEPQRLGLRPQDRGSIVHKALERIWHTLQNSHQLTQMDPPELLSLIQKCATDAIETITHKKTNETRYLSLELQRLKTLLLDWLHQEKQRSPFKVIAQEQEYQTTIGNIPLTIRIDRIDELEDGSHFIIDYKTGKNNHIKHWFSQRPEEPQLPLYCLVNPDSTVGIAFAEIHPDQLSFKGISKKEMDISAIIPISKVEYANQRTWEDQQQEWQKDLNTLSNDFYQGNAAVNPKQQESCQYCQLQPLCRIYEKEDSL
jgi:ATP-dependent helicase/nuclease subunit B